MASNQQAGKQPLLQFGEFVLDAERHGLYKHGQRVHLTPKPMETLTFLVLNRGRVVRKQELLDAVWKDTFVGEDTLVQAVREIRLALDDDRRDPRFIQTIPREGYRFVCEVISLEPTADPSSAPSSASDTGERTPGPASAPGQAASTPTRRTWRWILPVALVVVAAIALVLFYLTGRQPGTSSLVHAPTLHQLTSSIPGAMKPAFSSEGNMLYVERGIIHIRPAATDDALEITNQIYPSGDMPTFTADGGRVVFARPRTDEAGNRTYDLLQVDSIGGAIRPFLNDAVGAGFSPDGLWAAYTKILACDRPLWVSRVNDSRRVVQVSERGFTPRWSPDGKRLAYTDSDPNGGLGSVWIVSLNRGQGDQLTVADKRQLTSEREQIYGLTWTSDSRSIIFAARRQGRMHLYWVGIADGAVKALTTGAGDYSSPCASPDGKSLVFSYLNPVSDLLIGETAGCEAVKRVTQDEYHRWPRFSPSGERLVSVSRRPDYDERVYVFDLGTMERRRASEQTARHPSWMDEETVVYLVDTPSGKTRVCASRIVGGVTVALTEFEGEANWLAVHPNQRELAVVLGPPGCTQKVVLRSLDQPGKDLVLAEGNEYEHLRWLPGGSALSWSGPSRSSGQGGYGVWVLNRGDRDPHKLVRDGYGPVWSQTGEVVYFSRIGPEAGLWKFDLRQKTESRVCNWETFHFKQYDVAGARLVVNEQDARTQIYSMTLAVD